MSKYEDQFAFLTPKQKKRLKEKLQSGEIDMNSDEVKDLIKLRYENDPIGFAKQYCPERFKDPRTGELFESPAFHQEMLDIIDDEEVEEKRFALAAPRGHAKSTLLTFIYTMHAMLFEKAKFIVIISASEDIAKRFVRTVRDEFEYNEDIKWLFGDLKTDKWSETEFTITNKATLIAKGRGAQLRGLQQHGKRPDLVICDDLEDDELVLSELRRMDLENWFVSALLPAVDPIVGKVVLVGTVLHMDSLLNRLLNPELYPDFTTRKYQAIQKDGSTLWPERYPPEKLEKEKQNYMTKGKLSKFFMEYQNDPAPDEAAKFRQEYFQYFEDLPPRQEIALEMFVDLGGGGASKENADPTAMVVIGLDNENTFYVHDYVNRRFGTDTNAMINTMFDLARKHQPSKITIENTMATNMIKSALKIEMKKRGMYLNIDYVNPTRGSGGQKRGNMSDGKYMRIAALEAPFKFGGIKIRKWMTELQEQLIMFPRGQHDDLIDALSYGYMHMTPRLKPRDERLARDESYEALYPEIGL